MPTPVYSTRFAGLNLNSTTAGALYTVDSAHVAVVRDVQAIATSAGDEFELYIAGAAFFLHHKAAAPGEQLSWQGRVVLESLETLGAAVIAGAFQLCVSGYLLLK